MTKTSPPRLTRRHALAGAGTAGALAAAAVALPLVPAAQTASPSSATGNGSDDQGRYQVTQHVLRYYQTAKV